MFGFAQHLDASGAKQRGPAPDGQPGLERGAQAREARRAQHDVVRAPRAAQRLGRGLDVAARRVEYRHRKRIEENSRVFDFSLSDEEIGTLDAFDRTGGTDEAREQKWW